VSLLPFFWENSSSFPLGERGRGGLKLPCWAGELRLVPWAVASYSLFLFEGNKVANAFVWKTQNGIREAKRSEACVPQAVFWPLTLTESSTRERQRLLMIGAGSSPHSYTPTEAQIKGIK
jgi:hypothetical protein